MFDPNKPFKVLDDRESVGFDPNKPFKVIKEDTTGFDPSKPFKVIKEDTTGFDPSKPFKVIKEEDPGFFEQIKEGVTSPLDTTEKQKHSFKAKQDAKKFLKSIGYDPKSPLSSLKAGVLGAASAATGGQAEEIAGGIHSIFSDKSYEELKSMYEAAASVVEEDSPIATTVGEIAGFIGTGLTPLGLGTKVVAGTAQAAGLAAEKAEEGKETEAISRALTQEVIGLGIGAGLMKGLGKSKDLVANAMSNRTKKEMIDEFGSEQAAKVQAHYARMKQVYDETIPTIEQLNKKQLEDFSTVILAGQDVEEYAKRYKDLDEALDAYRGTLARRASVLTLDALPGAKDGSGIFRYVGLKMMDAQFVGAASDRRYHTTFMKDINDTSRGLTEGLHISKSLKTQAQKTVDELGYETLEESKQIIKDTEVGKDSRLVPLFEEMRQVVNMLHGEEVVKKLKDKPYIPHYMKPTTETTAVLRDKIKQVTGKDAKKIELEDIEAIKADKELYDSIKYVSHYGGKKERMLADGRIRQIVRTLGNRQNVDLFDVGASSVRERINDEVPELIRDYDIGRVLGSYIDSTVTDAMLRKPLRKIKAQADGLMTKDPIMANYMLNYVKDMSGAKRGFAGGFKKVAGEFSTKNLQKSLEAKRAGNLKTAKAYETLAEFPQYAQFAQAQLYPAYLGNRPDAVIRNMTQPYMLTIPSIGGSIGYKAKLIAQSIPKSAKFGLDKKSIDILESKGWLPPDPTPGAFQELRKGVASGSKFTKGAKKLNEKATNFAMYAYQQSDIANRVVTLHVGETLAKDVAKGNKSALAHIQQLPPAYKSAAKQAIQANDIEKLQDVITDHLMATTQFNYNRASMSEFGREAGSMFAMFSKWPTAIGADIYDGYDAHTLSETRGKTRLPSGTQKILKKYVGPYLVLAGANYAMTEATGNKFIDWAADLEKDSDPRTEAIFGKNITSAAPIHSVTGVWTNPARQFTPPIASIFVDLWEGKPESTLGIIPQIVYPKFYYEKLPAIMENRPGVKLHQGIKEDLK
jgi:hypothetical protein